MNILITGGNNGLGKFLSQHYQEKNNIAICSKNMKFEVRSLRFITSKCDIRDINKITHFLQIVKFYFL